MNWQVLFNGKMFRSKAYDVTKATILINGEWVALKDVQVIQK